MIGSQRSYVNNVAGQLHVWHWQGTEPASPPLICLPPVPYGGRFFHTFASALGGRVWSADLPGYGCSDALADLPTVSGYTEAMAPLLRLVTQPVCLLGFHSGTLVAIEMANRYPEQISGLVLVDVPVFSSPDLAKVSASLTDPPDYPQQKDPLNRLFQSMVMDRLDKVPYERALTLFFDFLGSGERRNAGFHAATSYDVQGPSRRDASSSELDPNCKRSRASRYHHARIRAGGRCAGAARSGIHGLMAFGCHRARSTI